MATDATLKQLEAAGVEIVMGEDSYSRAEYIEYFGRFLIHADYVIQGTRGWFMRFVNRDWREPPNLSELEALARRYVSEYEKDPSNGYEYY